MSDEHDVRQWWIAVVGLGERGPVVPPDALTPAAFHSKAEADEFASAQDLPTHVSLLEPVRRAEPPT